jgi:hypothetical protein
MQHNLPIWYQQGSAPKSAAKVQILGGNFPRYGEAEV